MRPEVFTNAATSCRPKPHVIMSLMCVEQCVSQRKLEMAEVIDVTSKFWEGVDRQQALEATVDVRHFARLGQEEWKVSVGSFGGRYSWRNSCKFGRT